MSFANTMNEQQLRDYLAQNGVSQEDITAIGDNVLELRQKVRQKRRRLLIEAAEANGSARTGVHSALSLDAFKSLLVTINDEGHGPKAFVSIKAKLVCVEGKITVLRHEEGQNACRSLVVDGRCSKCDVATPGVWAFAMSLVLEDLADSDNRFDMPAYKALARDLLGSSNPAVVSERSRLDILDTLEPWFESPVKIDVIVEYDAAKGRARYTPYNIARLPLDYMTTFE